VLLNLYSNSLKFTARKGKISIIIDFLRKRGKDCLRLSVMDTGIGIKKKNKKKLFKLFGSIKDEKKQINTNGIGLGLVISKMIVSKFNGFIDFVSKYKKGSTFFYTIEVENFDFEMYKLAQVSKIKEKGKFELKRSKNTAINQII
jgi:signal transduction histidine kinase